MRLTVYAAILSILYAYPQTASGQSEKIFKTKYTRVYYTEEKDMDDFLWRLGGSRFEYSSDTSLASNRIDRIIERVESILDMRPKNFNIAIYLDDGPLNPERRAFYDHKTRAIYVSVENSSEGVFAHEIAHAILNQYFSSPPPSKIQEILAQYVDKYLWSDY